jgi:hypothetical protein
MKTATFDRESNFFLTVDFLLGGAATPKTKKLLSVDQGALAMQGYNPVAFSPRRVSEG